ncbi:MAG: hypothetical protein HXS41_10215 [Theionarchaea archaeon]|nr:hypothetical protein [Theionarchaea archaeon]MBU7001560.1 hypothetical protein [Theionarchaea archaeon]MBU7021418.1 hypothetical protein [Theionarchaea archaeon]
MDLVNPGEREQLRKRIVEKIRPDVADLFIGETERILKERYNVSPEDLGERQVLSEADVT